MRLRFLVVSFVVLALSAGTGFAQTFKGTFDGYWEYNTITPRNAPTREERRNQYRAFDIRDQSFSLNYAEVSVDYKPNQVGMHIDWGFGDAADVVNVNANDLEFLRYVQQAYLTGTKDKFTLDFGKFVTPIGAEVIETVDNWNYSRGLLFTWAIPFYHFGPRGTYVANDKVTISGYVVNGWNDVIDNNVWKSLGVNGNFKVHPKLNFVFNGLWGKELPGSETSVAARQLYEGILTFNLNEKASFQADYVYVKDRAFAPLPNIDGQPVFWQGIAGYIRVKPNPKVTLAARYEWFGDHSGCAIGGFVPSEFGGGCGTVHGEIVGPTTTLTFPGPQDLQSYTGTVTIPWSDLSLWAEFRRDTSDVDSFIKWRQGIFGPVPSLVDGQNTFTIGMTYAFTKTVK